MRKKGRKLKKFCLDQSASSKSFLPLMTFFFCRPWCASPPGLRVSEPSQQLAVQEPAFPKESHCPSALSYHDQPRTQCHHSTDQRGTFACSEFCLFFSFFGSFRSRNFSRKLKYQFLPFGHFVIWNCYSNVFPE